MGKRLPDGPFTQFVTSRRVIFLVTTILLVGGSLAAHFMYGLRIRGDAYRAEVERDLSRFFELPCRIGRIRPQTFDSRIFERVEVWLPHDRDRVFSCERAIWHESDRNGLEARELELRSGILNLGSDRWETTDYRQVLRSGLEHNFEDLNLVRVELADFEVGFRQAGIDIRCADTSGILDMSHPPEGTAQLVTYRLNGYRVDRGVSIHARFSVLNGIDVSSLALTLPEVPLATIGVGPFLRSDIKSGRFTGEIEYHRASNPPEILLKGRLDEANLAELTARLPTGPLQGRLSLNIDHARIVRRIPTHLRGRGEISGLDLAPLASWMSYATLSGTADLNVQWADLAMGHVNRLLIDGQIAGLSLAELLEPWGKGRATGDVEIAIHAFRVVDDRLESADIEITALPPAAEPGILSRTLIIDVAQKLLHFEWPSMLPQKMLPENIEYAQLGVRLVVRDNKLRILGTHGPKSDTILTLRVFGQDIGLIKHQDWTIDISPWVDKLLTALRTGNPREFPKWPTTAPRRSGRESEPQSAR